MKSFEYIHIYIVSLKWQLARLEGKIMSTAIIDYIRSLFAIVWITTVLSTVCVWDLCTAYSVYWRFAKYLFLWFLWLQHKAGKSFGSVLSLFERRREGKHFPNTPCLRDFFKCFLLDEKILNPLLLCLFSDFLSKISCEHQLTLIIWLKKEDEKTTQFLFRDYFMAAMISQDPVILTNQENSWLHVHKVFETQSPDLSKGVWQGIPQWEQGGGIFPKEIFGFAFSKATWRIIPWLVCG